MSDYSLYLIRLPNGHLYTGISNNVERRFAEHEEGGKKAARFLKGKGAIQLVFCRKIGSRSDALKAEAAVKKLPKSSKESLIKGEFDFQTLIGD